MSSKWSKRTGGPAGDEVYNRVATCTPQPFVKSKRAQTPDDDETWKRGEVSPTLNHFDVGDARATTVVAFAQDRAGVPATRQQAFSVREDATAGTFSATPAEVGLAVQSLQPSPQSHHAQIFIAEQSVSHTSDGVVADPITAHEGRSWTNEGNTFRLRNCVQQPVGTDLWNLAITGDIAATMATSAGPGVGPTVMQHMAVRRLTPLECERLQGFPDHWTRIPWRKRPAEECPDGPRYRALGNSMAVPVMRWIGERIDLVDAIA